MAKLDWEKANRKFVAGKKKDGFVYTGKTLPSKFKSYCSVCHYTIWEGEKIKYDGKAKHLDCTAAITDSTNRILHPEFVKMWGQPKKSKISSHLKKI